MKTLIIFGMLLFCGFNAVTQVSNEEKNFVVVGTFRNLGFAERYIAELNAEGFDAHCAVRSSLNLYYVYILETASKAVAQNLLAKIKPQIGFKNAWLFHGNFNPDKPSVNPSVAGYLVESPVAKSPESKPYYFKVLNKKDGQELTGNLLIQETDGSSAVWVKSGELVEISKPQNEHHSFRVVALIPGYRDGSIVCFFDQPAIEIGKNNESVVTLALEKARAENFIDFNNVRFVGNSSFLRTVSQYEMNDFADFLKANPNEKIIIHCHSNGRQEQEFAAEQNMMETSNFKSLSVARAESVKSYLVQQGIDPSRIFTHGGGLETEVGNSARFYLNSVEIEFVNSELNKTLW